MMRLFTALALAIVVASPALAQSSNRDSGLRNVVPPKFFSDHFGAYNRSQFGEGVVRERAIRECNEQGRRYTQHLWGNMELDLYRSCMADRGLWE